MRYQTWSFSWRWGRVRNSWKDPTTRRQTNLLQDGIGRYFGIELDAISFFPVLIQCIRRKGHGSTRSLIFGHRVFRNELPAQTPDVHGAALCLAPAVNLESNEIVEWLNGEIVRTPSGDPAPLTDSTGRISHPIVQNDCRPASIR